MKTLITDYYLWFKALHILAVIALMAAMLYLPRLFVYHTETTPGAPDYERFCRMEKRLMNAIMTPSLIVVWVVGLLLVWAGGWHVMGWMQLKFVLVLALSAMHGMNRRYLRAFQQGQNRKSARFFRIWNEIPAVLLIAIVILVVVKPF